MLPTLTNAASKACGFQLGPQEGEAQWLANQGLWWFRPIGRTRGGFPIGHAAHFPDAVFMAFSGHAVTIASSTASLIPSLLLRERLSRGPRSQAKVRGPWGDLAGELREVHDALGGTDFERIDALVQESELDAGAAWVALDGDASLAAIAEGNGSVFEGPWASLGRAIAFKSRFPFGKDTAEDARAAWRFLCGNHGLDTSPPTPASLLLKPNPGVAVEVLKMAAGRLGQAPEVAPSDDPRLGVALSIADPEGFRVASFIRAVELLADDGQNAAAWDALCSAAFWTYQRSAAAAPEIVALAKTAAERFGMADAASWLHGLE